jgi:hypothetical protein
MNIIARSWENKTQEEQYRYLRDHRRSKLRPGTNNNSDVDEQLQTVQKMLKTYSLHSSVEGKLNRVQEQIDEWSDVLKNLGFTSEKTDNGEILTKDNLIVDLNIVKGKMRYFANFEIKQKRISSTKDGCMKHLATIQTEFLKEARKWEDLSIEDQRAYLKRHPASKRKLTSQSSNRDRHGEVKDKDKIFAKAVRFTTLKDVGDNYDKFFSELKAKHPTKEKVIDDLKFKIDDANSINYSSKHDRDSKDKTPEEKLKTKRLMNKVHGDIKKLISKL